MISDKLRAMIALVGVVTFGGVGFWLATPQPATRTMLELRDAGIADGQSLIIVCSEQMSRQTRRRIDAVQPGFLRPRQKFARIARVAKCFAPDGGNCFKPATWAALLGDLEGTVIIPSLRANLIDIDLDASVADVSDGGDSSAVDDGLSYDRTRCEALKCATYDAGVAPGIPWPDTPCGALNRLWAETPPCVIPDCRTSDGGWDDHLGDPGHDPAPNCQALVSPPEGGPATPRWAGCNTMSNSIATGTACIPVECGMVFGAGDVQDVLVGY